MPDFDINELLPFFLDETDEQIAVLNESLLRLEQHPADAEAIREAFRMAHSIKGAARLMGFARVEQLTHHLESYFEELRNGSRTLDQRCLEASFRCLDALRDFLRDLRATGSSNVDFSECLKAVLQCTQGPEDTSTEAAPPKPAAEEHAAASADRGEPADASIQMLVVFERSLAWKDMKARLILSRLAERAQVVASEPPLERIEEVEALSSIRVWVVPDGNVSELRAIADVDGVSEVRIEGESPASGAQAATPAEAPNSASALVFADKEEPAARIEFSDAVIPAVAANSPVPQAPAAGSGRKARVGETLRVDVDRLDHLMNLAGELVINKARFGQIMAGLKAIYGGSDVQSLAADTDDRFDSLARALDHLERNSAKEDASVARWKAQFRQLRDNVSGMVGQLDSLRRGHEHLQSMTEAMDHLTRIAEGIQKGVLETRMVPIGPLFERFRRVVRDLSVSSGKQVNLRLEGESTELDKRMVDELADPLTHMIRNAVDHGLEPPAQRAAHGKPAAGSVVLQAAHRGNSVVITVSDDGRGIDVERIRRKTVAQGLLREAEARSMTDRQLIAYIWHPGLSTAEQVTDLSGRGVGMDIVKAHIENLNGTVDVRTEPGRGTTFTIRLPLTLAILPSLVVRIYDEYYAIPLDSADEIIEVRASSVRRVHGSTTLDNRGRVVPMLELYDVFRWGGRTHPSRAAGAFGVESKATVVMVQDGETQMGLRVDELVGIQEVVLKSLERNFRAVPGLSGASILGDGRVSLILDIDTVIGMACNGRSTAHGHNGADAVTIAANH